MDPDPAWLCGFSQGLRFLPFAGIFLIMISAVVILIAGLFTGVKIPQEQKDQ